MLNLPSVTACEQCNGTDVCRLVEDHLTETLQANQVKGQFTHAQLRSRYVGLSSSLYVHLEKERPAVLSGFGELPSNYLQG
jgi:hypothetical protein